MTLFSVLHSLHIDLQVVEEFPREGQDNDEAIEEYYKEDPDEISPEDSAYQEWLSNEPNMTAKT